MFVDAVGIKRTDLEDKLLFSSVDLCDVKCNDKDASKPVARHFNLPSHSTQNMAICGLSMH